jgi:hypothetical protein
MTHTTAQTQQDQQTQRTQQHNNSKHTEDTTRGLLFFDETTNQHSAYITSSIYSPAASKTKLLHADIQTSDVPGAAASAVRSVMHTTAFVLLACIPHNWGTMGFATMRVLMTIFSATWTPGESTSRQRYR